MVGRVLVARNNRQGRPLGNADLEDLTQDVLVIVWRKLVDYRGEAPLGAWVYGICSLEYFNAQRRFGRDRRVSSLEQETVQPEAPSGGSQDEDLGHLLKHLSAREAEVVRLRHIDCLQLKEVGSALGISTSSAKTHYYRALSKLRELIQGGPEARGETA